MLGTFLTPVASAPALDQPVDFDTQGEIASWVEGGSLSLDQQSAGTVATFEDDSGVIGIDVLLPDQSPATDVVGFSSASGASGLDTFLRPSPIGGQVVFVAESADDVDEFAVEFVDDVVSEVVLPEGGTVLSFGGELAVMLHEPWAYDSRGTALATEYQIVGNEVRQIVDVADAVFPVIADPAWTYTFQYEIDRTPPNVRALLTSPGGFHHFPVDGRPTNFPANNQFLPLTVAGMNFNCYMNGVHEGVDEFERWWGFSFRAAPSHVDGSGSSIRFTFLENVFTPRTHLYVYAVIQNDQPAGIPRDLYLYGAQENWFQFALNINLAPM